MESCAGHNASAESAGMLALVLASSAEAFCCSASNCCFRDSRCAIWAASGTEAPESGTFSRAENYDASEVSRP